MTSVAEYQQMDDNHKRIFQADCFSLMVMAVKCPEMITAEHITRYQANAPFIATLLQGRVATSHFGEAEIDKAFENVKARADVLGVPYEVPSLEVLHGQNDVPFTKVGEDRTHEGPAQGREAGGRSH